MYLQHGYTPLIIATKLKKLKFIEILADAGADLDVQSAKEVGMVMYIQNGSDG